MTEQHPKRRPAPAPEGGLNAAADTVTPARRDSSGRHSSAQQISGQHVSGQALAHQSSRPRQRDLARGTRVGIIGVGRVGGVLGAALTRAGYPVVAAYGLSEASRSRSARLLPGVPIVTPAEVLATSDIVLITVPDDPLPGLVSGLAASENFHPEHVIVHTSGRHGIGVLAPAARAGAATLAVHPAMTFTGTAADLDRLAGSRFGVTAPAGQTALAMALVEALGGVAVRVAESDRTLYHAALAHGANHLVTLVADAMALLRKAGNDDPAATLGPLLHAALDNALAAGDAALTGPVARGDAGTVSAHISEIARVAPDSVDLYVALARNTAARAVADGRLRAADATTLLDVLSSADEAVPDLSAAPSSREQRTQPQAHEVAGTPRSGERRPKPAPDAEGPRGGSALSAAVRRARGRRNP